MLKGGQPDKPAIQVFSAAPADVEREVLAGIEEESVPFVVSRRSGDAAADALAEEAAQLSSLDVGVGIDHAGHVCIRHALGESMPGLYSEGPAHKHVARMAGHNAARIVVGIPLRITATAARTGAR